MGLTLDQLKKNFKESEKIICGLFRQHFRDQIKINFLLDIYTTMVSETLYFTKIMDYYPDFSNEEVSVAIIKMSLDICNNIIGIHTFNTLFMEDYDRAQLQKDIKYKKELMRQVYMHIKMRITGSMLFFDSKTNLVADFLYFPPLYYMHYIVYNLLNISFSPSNDDPKIEDCNLIIYAILRRMKSLFAVINTDIYESGYPILRGAVELYATYIILKYGHCDYSFYEMIMDTKLRYDCDSFLNDDFLNAYKKKNNVEIHSYLNYGWLDGVEEALYLRKDNIYKFGSLAEIVNSLYKKHKKDKKDFGSVLMKHYNKCHVETHGSMFTWNYPIIQIMNLCNICGDILMDLLDEIKDLKLIKPIDGVDIVKECNRYLIELEKHRKNLNKDILEKYYKNRRKI